MRVYIIVAATLAFFVTGNAKGTVVDTGADAQKYCQLFVGDSFRDNGEARSAGSCEGMIETAMLFAPNLPADVRGCPPAQGSTLEKRQGPVAVPRKESESTERGWDYPSYRSIQRCLAVPGRRWPGWD